MRKFKRVKPDIIEADFQKRVMPSLKYCQRVGNIMGATTHLALASTIDHGSFESPKRLGIFSYGSGCCSEFYSGVVTSQSQEVQAQFRIDQHLNDRTLLSVEEYEETFGTNKQLNFGTRDYEIDLHLFPKPLSHVRGKGRLIFKEIKNFHRIYEWV